MASIEAHIMYMAKVARVSEVLGKCRPKTGPPLMHYPQHDVHWPIRTHSHFEGELWVRGEGDLEADLGHSCGGGLGRPKWRSSKHQKVRHKEKPKE